MSKQITIDSLTPRTRAVIDTFLANPSWTYDQIAKAVGVCNQRVSQILRSPKVVALYPIFARRTIQSRLLPKALKRYEEIIEHSDNDAVAEKASQRVLASENVLDGPKITVKNEISSKTIQELREMAKRGLEIQEPVIDAEIVDGETT